VLDHDQREPPAQARDQLGDARDALGAQARGGLVEEEQPRVGASATPISSARRSPYDRLFASPTPCPRAHVGQHLRRALARRAAPPRVAETSKPRGRNSGRGDGRVLERAVVVEEVHHLEGARDAELRDAPGSQPGHVPGRES
jgi:hypothetical protein